MQVFRVALLLAIPAVLTAQGRPAATRPRAGLVITHSMRISPGSYRLPAPGSSDSALITIRGDNLEVDFTGVVLDGAPPGSEPDGGAGIAVLVDGGRNIVIHGARIRGYKVGILVRGTRGLKLNNNDLSHNWKPRLFSLVEHESLADWLSFHHNENGEWLRFGAGIYLDRVSGGDVQGNTVRQGMNGLLVNRSDHLRIEGNDFSFNSGLGIGMYRSSDNTVAYNTVEYDVRGYSHGFYRRGQDSAGILMYEQSCRNVVAWNSVTHGGDGLFVWAGQTTMDSGQGGVNDNLFFGNDFSWAPTNGMEATFSRNTFAANLIEGSDHGLWGGYSFSSKVVGNRFVRNRVGIAIEHGQDNLIAANLFVGDTTAIYLWADAIEPSDWGYPKFRDTRGRDYRVANNLFHGNRVGIRSRNTMNLAVTGNHLLDVDSFTVLRDTAAFRADANGPLAEQPYAWPVLPTEYAQLSPDSIGGPLAAPLSPLARRDRSTIVVDEWGPYDWRSPKLWPADSARAVPLRLAVLGPAGRWRVVSRRGLESLSPAAGRTGDTISVTPSAAAANDWELVLEYRGAATVSPSGQRRGAGAPVRFSYGRFEPRAEWSVRFYTWSDSTSPQTRPEAFAELLRGTPLLARSEPRLDYMWYRPTIWGLPQARFALEASATVSLAPGDWTLRTISDDAVRVWVDGVLVIDDWTPHESAVDSAPLSGGAHQLRVQHYQADGWTELRLDIVRGSQRSRGSPGPH
jgi:parallel beta-helix repeat protein